VQRLFFPGGFAGVVRCQVTNFLNRIEKKMFTLSPFSSLQLTRRVMGAIYQPVRTATKKAGGSTKNGRDSKGKHLGVKKFGGQVVIPGNIIIRQRGLSYRNGENVGLGRDYTIFSLVAGRVKFTYDLQKKRQIVSVVPNA
jgi:large subunit ribosomal protein L27